MYPIYPQHVASSKKNPSHDVSTISVVGQQWNLSLSLHAKKDRRGRGDHSAYARKARSGYIPETRREKDEYDQIGMPRLVQPRYLKA